MNITMVCRLIWKDWYLNKAGVLASLIGGVATLALVAAMHGSQVALILGIIVLVTILIGMGAMVMISASNERKQLTLPFVMSLPISYREYTTSKIVGGMLIFLALWVPLVGAIVATILLTSGIPHGMIPFVLIMAVEILMSTCLITVVAVTTESHGWTVAVSPGRRAQPEWHRVVDRRAAGDRRIDEERNGAMERNGDGVADGRARVDCADACSHVFCAGAQKGFSLDFLSSPS